MKNKIVKEKYRNLINDADFDRVELQLKTPNIFQILGVTRTEIRHSNFIAWLLDPNGSHGLGKIFITKLLRDISASEIASELDEFSIEELNYNNVEIRREWKNIDLLIIFDSHVICIENKVDSKDHSNQLEKYRNIVNENFKSLKKVFIYLTPNGDYPSKAEEKEYYIIYSYESIIEQLEKIIDIHKKSISQNVNIYISDYLATIKRELMKNDELNLLANRIYKNHKELIDFVYEHKSDIALELYPIIEKKIIDSGWVIGSRGKGYVRFLTPNLDRIIPKKGLEWKNKENFLFELDFFWSKKNATFKTTISPSKEVNEDIRKILKKALESDNLKAYKEYNNPTGKKWFVHLKHTWKFDKENLFEINEDEVLENINNQWEKITKIVDSVEKEILNFEEELIKLK